MRGSVRNKKVGGLWGRLEASEAFFVGAALWSCFFDWVEAFGVFVGGGV